MCVNETGCEDVDWFVWFRILSGGRAGGSPLPPSSRPVLGPTQPRIQWTTRVLRGGARMPERVGSEFVILRNCDLFCNFLYFITCCSGRRHVHAVFLMNVFKGKTNCESITYTSGIPVLTRQIKECLPLRTLSWYERLSRFIRTYVSLFNFI
jgi:hypothetical protein